MLDELDVPDLIAVSGDPRNTFLYFRPGTDNTAAKMKLEEELMGRVVVATVDDLKATGWLGNEVANSEFLPDLYLLSTGAHACYHRGFCKPQSLRMIGQHGSITQAELSVPLLKFGTVLI
jgi:hypothetical protein